MKSTLKFKKITMLVSGITLSALIALSFINVNNGDPKPWKVPDQYNKMKNPVNFDDEAMKIGKTLYAKHCQSCHGKTGKGDGNKASELETPTGDFSLADFQSQTDGALFYKTKEGRDDMPSFKKKIADDEDIWILVHYMRTFKKK
jgi:mono/diheme cytochrome c family protein